MCIYNFVLIISLHEQTTLTALGEMFEAARSIMSWLGDCAKVCLIYLVIYLLIMQVFFGDQLCFMVPNVGLLRGNMFIK